MPVPASIGAIRPVAKACQTHAAISTCWGRYSKPGMTRASVPPGPKAASAHVRIAPGLVHAIRHQGADRGQVARVVLRAVLGGLEDHRPVGQAGDLTHGDKGGLAKITGPMCA